MPVYNPTQPVSGSYVGNDHLNPITPPTAGAYTIEDGVTWYFNGSVWFSVTRPQFTQGGANLLYFSSTSNGVGIETLSNTPDLSALDLETISLPNAGVREYLNHGYKADTVIGVTEIPAGQWGFKVFASAGLAGHGTTLQFEVGTTDGTTPTWHFTVDSPVLTSTEITEYDFVTVQPAILCGADEFITVRVSAISETNNTSVTWVHSSSTAYSCFSPPQIPTLHDDLSGLNAGDFRHLTLTKEAALDDLIANGGGGGGTSSETVTFVTDNNLTSGQPVVLKTTGHVGNVGLVPGLGVIEPPLEAITYGITYTAVAYSSLANKYLAVGSTGEGFTFYIGTPQSGGKPTTWVGAGGVSGYTPPSYANLVYNAADNKFVLTWANSLFNLFYIIGTVSSGLTSVTWGTAIGFNGTATTHGTLAIYGRSLVHVGQQGGRLQAQVGTIAVGGDSISFSTPDVINSVSGGTFCSLAYVNGLFVLVFTLDGLLKLQTATLVGGSWLSWGGVQPIINEAGVYTTLGYNPTEQKLVLVYKSDTGVIVYRWASSGNLTSWSNTVTLNTNPSSYLSLCFDSLNNLHTLVFQNLDHGSYAYYQTFALSSSTSNFSDYVGIAQTTSAANSTASVRVSGVDSLQSGLSVGQKQYLQSDGLITTTPSSVLVGKALTSTKLLLSPSV